MKRYTNWAAMIALLILSGCATPYGESGLTGGYSEEQLGENVYRVRFQGNGNTNEDKVWNYWMYRCAELTQLKGFNYLHVTVEKKQAGLDADPFADQPAFAFTPREPEWDTVAYRNRDPAFIKTKGGGGAPIYIYTPGYTVRTWSAQGVVRMYKHSQPLDVDSLLDAQSIINSLGPYIKSEGETPSPDRKDLLNRALVIPSKAVLPKT